MKDDPMNPQVNEFTEGMSVMLPELRDMPLGHRITVMVGTIDMLFEVIGHDGDETMLLRVGPQKRKKS